MLWTEREKNIHEYPDILIAFEKQKTLLLKQCEMKFIYFWFGIRRIIKQAPNVMESLKNNLLLKIILISAFLIRIIAIYPGYPPTHPDEPLTYDKAVHMILSKSLDPHKYDYPMLPMYLHMFSYLVVFLPATFFFDLLTKPSAIVSQLANINLLIQTIIETDALYWGRLFTVFLAAASIYATYLLGKKIFNQTTGIISAFLLAINFRHFISSVLSLNDVLNALITVITLLLLLNLTQKRTRKQYIVLGVVLGVALSVKYQTFILLPFAMTQLLIGVSTKGSYQRKIKNIVNTDSILVLLIMSFVFIVINIYPLLHFKEWTYWLDQVTTRYGIGRTGFKTYPLWFLYTMGLGQVLSFLTLLGVIVAFIKKRTRKQTIVLMSLLVPIFFFYFYYIEGGIYVRNFTSFLPLLIIFGSYAIMTIAEYLFAKRAMYIFALIVLTFLASFPSLRYSFTTAYYLSRETNNTCIQQWLAASMPKGVTFGIIPPILPTDSFIIKHVKTIDINPRSDFTILELQKKGIEYVAINNTTNTAYLIKWIYQGTKFFNEPIDILDNTFDGLAIRELVYYKIASCIKPWPVFDDNYLIIKVPTPHDENSMAKVATFSYDEKSPRVYFELIPSKTRIRSFQIVKNGDCRNSCLLFSVGSPPKDDPSFPSDLPPQERLVFPPRIQSTPIPISPNTDYKLTTRIKPNTTVDPLNRDGFIRLDFYDTKQNVTIRKPLMTFISNRAFGNTWTPLSVEGLSPSNARFMTIAIQTEYYQNNFLIDSINLYATANTDEKNQEVSFDRDIFYPSFIF